MPSRGTTNFSNVSVDGTPGQVRASRLSSAVSALVNDLWASSLSLGGAPLVGFSRLSVLIPAHVVQGSASSFTVGVWTGLVLGDVIITSPAAGDGTASSLSSGLVAHSHCTATGRYEFRYSNVSTLAQEQSAKSFNLVAIRPF